MQQIIGIDPGKSGAATVLSRNRIILDVMDFSKMTFKDISDGLLAWSTNSFAYIEKVHSMPRQGVSSTFKFGKYTGFLLGVLTTLEIPYEEITPQTWQKYLHCLSKGDKNVTKSKAQQLFPDLKWTHNTADSVLIAEYGRRIYDETSIG